MNGYEHGSQFLDGPTLARWLQPRLADDLARYDRGAMDTITRWRNGRRATVVAADRILTAYGLHLSEVPDEAWNCPQTQQRKPGMSARSKRRRLARQTQTAP